MTTYIKSSQASTCCSFETHLGQASITMSAKGVSRLDLPQIPLARPVPSAPSARSARSSELHRLIGEVQAYFRGERPPPKARIDLSGVTPFQRSVYTAARSIPPGRVKTYGEIARAIGRPRAARAVGAALGRNPIPLLIPCHRVVSSSGLGGFSASGGLPLKRRMLSLEGALLPR